MSGCAYAYALVKTSLYYALIRDTSEERPIHINGGTCYFVGAANVTRHEQNVFYEKYKIKTELEVTYI